MNNVYLTGLSGSGKSTLAKMLAERVGRGWLDTDTEIEKTAGMSIADIFSLYGEHRFRELEAEAVRMACSMHNLIVATGGGTILSNENAVAMWSTGTIVWLNRPVSGILCDLDTSTRPLARDVAAFLDMAEQRTPIYKERCDIEFNNDGTAEEAVEDIINILKL